MPPTSTTPLSTITIIQQPNNKVSNMNYGQPTMSGPKGIDDLIGELNDDNDSVSSEESINMTSSSKKAKRNNSQDSANYTSNNYHQTHFVI